MRLIHQVCLIVCLIIFAAPSLGPPIVHAEPRTRTLGIRSGVALGCVGALLFIGIAGEHPSKLHNAGVLTASGAMLMGIGLMRRKVVNVVARSQQGEEK